MNFKIHNIHIPFSFIKEIWQNSGAEFSSVQFKMLFMR